MSYTCMIKWHYKYKFQREFSPLFRDKILKGGRTKELKMRERRKEYGKDEVRR